MILESPSRIDMCAGAAKAGRGSGAGAGGKEDERLREVVLGEILDTRPSTRWDDVAGLSAAKQVWRIVLTTVHRA